MVVADDEHPRGDTTVETLKKLRPLFEGGVTTAGNASGINDGAAALMIASRRSRRQGRRQADGAHRRIRRCRRAAAHHGLRSGAGREEGAGARRALDCKDMDVIEINEAFAAQVLGCLKGLDIDFKDTRVNPNGGAIALGHPLGASGARIALTAARQLQRTGGRYALVSMCIGVGQGIAMVIERV